MSPFVVEPSEFVCCVNREGRSGMGASNLVTLRAMNNVQGIQSSGVPSTVEISASA